MDTVSQQNVRHAPSRWVRAGSLAHGTITLVALAALAAWAAAFLFLASRPALAIEQARGLYVSEADGAFRWTGSRAVLPLNPRSGPTLVRLTLGAQPWPGRPAEVPVQLSDGASATVSVLVGPPPRDYALLLPPSSRELRLDAPVDRPPGGEWRFLGVQIYGASADPSGLPMQAAATALIAAAAALPAVLGARWLLLRGYGAIGAITALGLAARALWLTTAPPGLHRDEAVSVVDAWSLLHTGRDHLGHLLPLAAFEAYGDWISPLLTYLELPLVALLGPQPLAARLVTALAGAAAVPAVYALARSLELPRAGALVAALVAALSPWQVFLSRVAIPPGLVPLTWTLCLLAAVRFVRFGRRRDALWLALAAGLGLYAYPTMKMAAPLLVALAVGCGVLDLRSATGRKGQTGIRNLKAASGAWWPAAALLALLWLPFVASALFNPAGGARFEQIAIPADTPGAFLAAWWEGYSVYLGPDFWYVTGDTRKIVRGIPGHGAELSATAPLVLLGLVALALKATGADARLGAERTRRSVPVAAWWLILLALLLAPLPASLTVRNPNGFRASTIPPLYALLCGMGAALLLQLVASNVRRSTFNMGRHVNQRLLRSAAGIVLALALLWQHGAWFRDLTTSYPQQTASTWFFADGVREAMDQVVARAGGFDEVWLDTDSIGRPYIYLLASRPMPPAESQAQIAVIRDPPGVNEVTDIGPYHFGDLPRRGVPAELPALDVVLDRRGGLGYVLQEWRHDGKRVLVVRGMDDLPVVDEEDE